MLTKPFHHAPALQLGDSVQQRLVQAVLSSGDVGVAVGGYTDYYFTDFLRI